MSRVPMMPVFTDAMIGGTVRLSAEQFGAYCLILFATWANNGNPLHDDDAELARVCRCTPARWRQKLRPALIGFFDSADGRLHQKRLENEFKLALETRAKKSAAGALGGKATQLKNRETRQATAQAPSQANSKAKLKQPIPIPIKKEERESLVINTQSPRAHTRTREATAPDTPTRPSLSEGKKNQEGEAEPPPRLSEIPEGWLAEAEAARDDAGLEPVNLMLEWLKFAARADGEVELRRWIEWSLRAWGRPEGRHTSAKTIEALPETPWAARMRHWHQSGWWHQDFGPKPDEPGCYVPPKYLA